MAATLYRVAKMDALRFPDVIAHGQGTITVIDLEQTRLACHDWQVIQRMMTRYPGNVTLQELSDDLALLVDANDSLASTEEYQRKPSLQYTGNMETFSEERKNGKRNGR